MTVMTSIEQQIPLGLSHHDALSSPYSFAYGKVVTWQDVSRLSDSTASRRAWQARLAQHVFRGVATA